ncbi:MAG: hypothetical protein IJC79_01105 [Clostridia bacterium]|nr:hypothetical protein [Clostridia bacterium]
MKKSKKLISLVLCLMLTFSFFTLVASAEDEKDYTIVSPYADVIWSGENAWGAYKGTIHSHTTYSDADEDLPTMVKEYYEQDYDFLANADHGVTGTPWNVVPDEQLLYSYQKLLGNSVRPLTDEEFEGITTGSYPLYDGTVRNKKMVCVTGANELNNLTLTKAHVNGYFLPYDKGNGFGGTENGFEQAIAYIEKNGGLSHINHPGDWLESNKDITTVSDPENIEFFGELLLKYPTCLGIEVFNETNSTTPYDRILWDNLLMYTLPYGKNVIGFSNTDAHVRETVDTSFSVFMMEENDVEHIKETMQTGALFMVTRNLAANDIIGPAEEINVRNQGLAYPMFTRLTTEGHKITVSAENASSIQWIANGKVIAESEIGADAVTLDLDTIEGAEDFQYVRAELFGEGGVCISQALVIDDGSEKLTYEEEKTLCALLDKILFALESTRLWTIVIELYRMIKYA